MCYSASNSHTSQTWFQQRWNNLRHYRKHRCRRCLRSWGPKDPRWCYLYTPTSSLNRGRPVDQGQEPQAKRAQGEVLKMVQALWGPAQRQMLQLQLQLQRMRGVEQIGVRFQPCSAIPRLRAVHSWYLTEDVCRIQWNINKHTRRNFNKVSFSCHRRFSYWTWSNHFGEQCGHIHSTNTKWYQHFLFRLLHIALSIIARKVQVLVGKATIWA